MQASYLLALYYAKKIYRLQGELHIYPTRFYTLCHTEIANPDAVTHKMKWLLVRVAVYVLIFFFVALPCQQLTNCWNCDIIGHSVIAFVATIIVLNERESLQIDEREDYIVIYWQVTHGTHYIVNHLTCTLPGCGHSITRCIECSSLWLVKESIPILL